MKPHGVIIKPSRKRTRPRHTGPATLKPRHTPLAPPTAATAVVGTRELQLARALSDTESEARDAALLALHAWLAEFSGEVSEGDLDKLCKALFYCVWMADGRPVISVVVKRVVGLGKVGGWRFLAAVLRCVVREWHGVDRHRVDKFYELVSVCVEACVARCLEEAGEGGAGLLASVGKLIAVVDGEVVSKAGKGASGVALHVLDYWEARVLTPVLGRAVEVLPQNDVVKVFEEAMRPVYGVLAATSGGLMAASRRAVERVCEPLPEVLAGFGLSDKARRDMVRRVMKKVWEAASNKATVEGCRKALYDVHAVLKGQALALELKGGVLPTRAVPVGKAAEGDAMETEKVVAEREVEKDMSATKAVVAKAMQTPRRRTRLAAKSEAQRKGSMEVDA
jgi:Nucleolar protein,Nop52